MNKEEFLKEIIRQTEIEQEIDENTKLEDIENWDSLAAIKLISLFNNAFKFRPDINELLACESIKEILDLAKDYYS